MTGTNRCVRFFAFLALFIAAFPLSAGRITVSGDQFLLNGQRIWINGANTPWDNWNDFGGSFDSAFWDSHFAALRANGINATRIWITCSGEVGINIDSTGYVSSATPAHWAHLDELFRIASNHRIHVMATLISFDHFKSSYSTYQRWRNWIASSNNVKSYLTNYLAPFVDRYKDNPWLWSIDLCNEPEWAVSDSGVSWGNLRRYFAWAASTIHGRSDILVSVGIAYLLNHQNVADNLLKVYLNAPSACLDFWHVHYYPWMDPWIPDIPFYTTPGIFGAGHGLDSSRPAVIGETPSKGSTGHSTTDDYESAFQNGWQGVMGWTSNGVDSQGSLTQLGPATRTFYSNHRDYVFPQAVRIRLVEVSPSSVPQSRTARLVFRIVAIASNAQITNVATSLPGTSAILKLTNVSGFTDWSASFSLSAWSPPDVYPLSVVMKDDVSRRFEAVIRFEILEDDVDPGVQFRNTRIDPCATPEDPFRTLFHVQTGQIAKLLIYSSGGELAASIGPSSWEEEGVYSMEWDGRTADRKAVPPGVYLAVLERSGRKNITGKVMVIPCRDR